MNPANPDFSNRTASSPALFNRCVIDWFGDWPQEALYQVGKEFTTVVDPSPQSFSNISEDDPADLMNEIIVSNVVYIHQSIIDINNKLMKSAKIFNYITPRDYLDFLNHFLTVHANKRKKL